MSAETPSDRRPWLMAAALLLFIGACLRFGAAQAYQPKGTDESLYGAYVNFLDQRGLGEYPALVEQYIGYQQRVAAGQKSVLQGGGAVLPPMRISYIVSGLIVKWITGLDPRAALNVVSALCSFLMLPLGLIFAWRAVGPKIAVGTLALMVFAPTQLFMARHALIDVVVALWSLAVLWTLWESLQKPGDPRWAVGLGLSTVMLLLTKENSFFVVCGLVVLLGANRWLKFGVLHRNTLIALAVSLLVSLVVMVVFCGGVDRVFEAYQLFVSTAVKLPYAIATGDGPWHRYLFELTLVSPLVMILALTMVVRLDQSMRLQIFFALFFVVTYAAMASVRYGMSLRFANLWDFPLRFLAASAVCLLVGSVRWRPSVVAAAIFVVMSCADFRQYRRIFVGHDVYDPVTPELLHAVDMLKFSGSK
jgi:hypothetical protein